MSYCIYCDNEIEARKLAARVAPLLAKTREDALEAAAKECDDGTEAGAFYAKRIRALKKGKQ